MAITFTCAMCGYVGIKRDEEEALEELHREFGLDVKPEDCEVVCDSCWEKIKPSENPLVLNAWKKHELTELLPEPIQVIMAGVKVQEIAKEGKENDE